MIEQVLRTPLTELAGVRHPVVQTGMGWVSGPRLVSGTANAGGLGILASATMTFEELEQAIIEVKGRTDRPFGVNLRADAADAPARCQLLIEYGVKVASFALAPKPELIAKLKEHDIVVMPSIGAAKHAVKVASWGADAVMVQGGEGGGHTGPVPTTLLLPAVPDAVKRLYLEKGLTDTVVTAKVDGMPHRMLRTELVEELEGTSALKRLGPTMRRTMEFKRTSGMSWLGLAKDGRSMKKAQGRTLGQMALAANTPMMLKAGLVDGDTGAGVLASGQVVGVIDDLPTCEELIDRIVTRAADELRRAASYVLPTDAPGT